MSSSVTPRTRALLQDSLWYAAAAASVGVAVPDAAAQVVYTNVEPDAVVTNTFSGAYDPDTSPGFDVDLDANGTYDVRFVERNLNTAGNPSRYIIGGLNVTSVTNIVGNLVPYGGSNFAYFLPVTAGTTIGPSSPEIVAIGTGTSSYVAATFTFGGSDPNGFLTAGETFLGLSFTLADGLPHYAWIRVEVPAAGGQITVKDFAYEATANTAIVAGNGVATEPGALAEGYLFSPLAPNPTTGTSSFDLAVGQAEVVRVEAFDALGRQVAVLHDGPLAASQTRRLSLDASGLPAGVYVVRVTGESFTTARRVTVAR